VGRISLAQSACVDKVGVHGYSARRRSTDLLLGERAARHHDAGREDGGDEQVDDTRRVQHDHGHRREQRRHQQPTSRAARIPLATSWDATESLNEGAHCVSMTGFRV